MAVTINGTTGIVTPDITSDSATIDSTTLVVDETNNRVGIGTTSPKTELSVDGSAISGFNASAFGWQHYQQASSTYTATEINSELSGASSFLSFKTNGNWTNGNAVERMRIDSSGALLIGKTTTASSVQGINLDGNFGAGVFARNDGAGLGVNRQNTDGSLVNFLQADNLEGTISVSGTTVSYNGGHLARWSQLADNTRDESIVKGTVMSNLDQMAEWTTDGVTEDNEQLNCMKVSDVEGDADVAGVFVNWDNDDDIYTNDMNIAMTGDMVIRIASGTTVARGDLLMSAGDGTAKPQGDDIVRSKTIAKVTSTHVSHTYDDGSYLVPCVLMAC